MYYMIPIIIYNNNCINSLNQNMPYNMNSTYYIQSYSMSIIRVSDLYTIYNVSIFYHWNISVPSQSQVGFERMCAIKLYS